MYFGHMKAFLKPYTPILWFLARFLGSYLVLSVLYGLYIRPYDASVPSILDPYTRAVGQQVLMFAELFGFETSTVENDHLNYGDGQEVTYDSLFLNKRYAISLEEGCNGISVMVLFVSFLIGFGGRWKDLIWFIPLGLLALHMANILRLFFLMYLNTEVGAQAFHFFHKYGFTAVIYAGVFALWIWWTKRNMPSA